MKKRVICLLLAITMLFSSVDVSVFAEETNQNSSEQQIVVETEEIVETEEMFEEQVVVETEVEVTTEAQFEVEEIQEETELKTENVYNLRTLFPDDALRFEVIRNIGDSSLKDDSEVTTTQLEKVTYLFGVGSTRVTDLTGIEKLTKLEQINLVNHEIESIDSIKWSELQELRDLNLNGNNIKKMPDLTQNLKLESIGLENNMLSEEEWKTIYDKIPSGVVLYGSFASQRTKMVELEIEDNYYVTNSGISVFCDIKGKKDYIPKFYIDDVEYKTESSFGYEIKNNELSYGSHKIRVELYNGKIKVAESEDYTFHIVDGESSFVERTYYTQGDDRYYEMLHVYFDTWKDIDRINLVNSSGKIYATVSSEVSMWETKDPRYKKFDSKYKVFCAEVSFDNVYNKLPIGLYNFEIIYADGTKDIAKNALKVIEQQEAALNEIQENANDMLDGDKYYDIVLRGYNLKPENFEYTIKWNGIEFPLCYVDSHISYDGYWVRLKKDDWINLHTNGYVTLTVTAKEGYTVQGDWEALQPWSYSEPTLVYLEYNNVVEKLEVCVNKQYLNQEMKVEIRDSNSDTYSVLATASGVVTEEEFFLDLWKADGTKFTPKGYNQYYCNFTIGEESELYFIYTNTDTESVRTNYWGGTSSVLAGTTSIEEWFYSDIPYNNVTSQTKNYSAQITGDGIKNPINAKKIWTGESDGNTWISMEFNPSVLGVGTYTITLYNGETILATRSIRIFPKDVFTLNSVSAYWISDSELQVNFGTPNVRKDDEFEVIVTEADGTVVEGLTIEKTTRSTSGTVNLILKGLEYRDAFRSYYIKVLHKTLGEPCRQDGTPYYSDEKGSFIEVYGSTGISMLRYKGRYVGVYVADCDIEFPASIKIYKPYDMELISEIIIKDASELTNGFYYFTQSNYESLPNSDRAYYVTWSDPKSGDQWLSLGDVLGYYVEPTPKTWSYTVDKTTLNIDSEAEKTGTILVKNYKAAPTFKSSNTAVVKVAVSPENKGLAAITAVGEGTADITITADGTEKKFTVTVVSTVPKVTAQNKVVINTFFGSEAATALEISNSFGTKITNVTVAETDKGLSAKEIDGKWYICWDGSTPIAKDTKITLSYEVEGFTASEDLVIAPQTITVNGTSTQPTAKLSATTLNFALYPFATQSVYVSVDNNDYRNLISLIADDIELTTVPSGVDKEKTDITISFDAASAKLTVNVGKEAKDGTYKYTITPGVGTDGAKDAKSVVLTLVVKATKPAFKFNASNVTLDAAYPGDSEGSIKLLMDSGFSLEDITVIAPNSSANDFISVEKAEDGTVIFKVIKAGLSTAGVYKVTPKVKAPQGEIVELAEQKITVKVTNSSTATLSSKSKSVTINPYLGDANVNAQLKVKGLATQAGVSYSYAYEFVPTNEIAKASNINFNVASDGAIRVSNCEEKADGKYTYNVIGRITGTDRTVTYTKPMAFTVQLKTKALTIVPDKKSVTVYADYCTTMTKNDTTYYQVEILVHVKEASELIPYTELSNSMTEKGVLTKFAYTDAGTKLIIEFPTELSGVKNMTVTPKESKYAAFKVSITVNKKNAPKAAFASKTVTLNRYIDAYVDNMVVDTEGYAISSIRDIVIKKGKTVIEEGWFDVNIVGKNSLSIGITQEYDADIVNSNYTVSVTPVIMINNIEKELAPCTFTLKVTQPNIKLNIGDMKTTSQKVNIYPSIDETSSIFAYSIFAHSEGEKLEIVEISVETKDKKIYTEAVLGEENEITFKAQKNEEHEYENGKNTYAVAVKVRKANGVLDTKVFKLNKAFIVTVCELPKSVKLEKTKLTFSPYLEDVVTTNIKSTELDELLASGNYKYNISIEETDSKYRVLTKEQKNNVLRVYGTEWGTIIVDNGESLPTINKTYYYMATVNFMEYGKDEPLKTYTLKLSVPVKNTLPKAKLQMSSVTLDNAFVNQEVSNNVILTSGTGLWSLKELSSDNIVIKSGKNDVTDKGYFEVTYEGSRIKVSLNNEKDGTLITVPKGTYKLIITPDIIERYGDKESSIAPITMTIKVNSSKPTIKMAAKATVKVGDEAVIIKPELKNNGKFIDMKAICTKRPAKADDADVEGIIVELLEDGAISIKAEAGVIAGSYTFAITPVIRIDGAEILLDNKNITVAVKK